MLRVQRSPSLSRVACAVLVLFIGGLAVSSPALGEAADAATRLANAKAAAAEGAWLLAAKEYQAAFDLNHDSSLLVTIAGAEERAGQGEAAVMHYRQYLEAQPRAADRAEVEKKIASLSAEYHVPPPAATPLNPPPGPRVIDPTTQPPTTGPAPTETPPGSTETAPAIPPAAPAGVVVPEPPPRRTMGSLEADVPSRMRIGAWLGVATTVVLLTTGGIFGLAAQERSDEISRNQIVVDNDGLPRRFSRDLESTFNDLRSEGQTYNIVGISLMSAAGAAAIVSGVLFYLDYHAGRPATRAHLAPSLSPTFKGFSASVEF